GIPFAKIDRSVHGCHSPLDQPVSGDIKEHVRSFLIINTVEKSDSAHRKFIPFILVPFIYKGSDPPQEVAPFILDYPPGNFSLTEGLVFSGVKNLVNVLVQWPNIARHITQDIHINLDEILCI